MMRRIILAASPLLLALASTTHAQIWGTLPDTTPSASWPAGWDTSHAGSALNRAGLSVAWQATFTAGTAGACLDATTGQPAIGVQQDSAPTPGYDLYAYTGSGFTGSVPGGVAWSTSNIDCYGNALNIHLTYSGGVWTSAGVASVDKWGAGGDSARFGLFEQKVVMGAPPTGVIPWPSAWYNNRWDPGNRWSYSEIDPMELGISGSSAPAYYGGIHQHNWPNASPETGPTGQLQAHRYIGMNTTTNVEDGAVHTYDMLVTPKMIVVYWDGVEIGRTPITGADQIIPWNHEFDVSMYYAPTGTTSWTATVNGFWRYECTPAPSCLDLAHS